MLMTGTDPAGLQSVAVSLCAKAFPHSSGGRRADVRQPWHRRGCARRAGRIRVDRRRSTGARRRRLGHHHRNAAKERTWRGSRRAGFTPLWRLRPTARSGSSRCRSSCSCASGSCPRKSRIAGAACTHVSNMLKRLTFPDARASPARSQASSGHGGSISCGALDQATDLQRCPFRMVEVVLAAPDDQRRNRDVVEHLVLDAGDGLAGLWTQCVEPAQHQLQELIGVLAQEARFVVGVVGDALLPFGDVRDGLDAAPRTARMLGTM